jgi:hypothetical protein
MSDLDEFSGLETYDSLVSEIVRLRNGIRKHRDAKGHARCWEDDRELYALLPEGNLGDQTLPPREEFLAGCHRYYELRRQKPNEKITCPICDGIGGNCCNGTGHQL